MWLHIYKHTIIKPVFILVHQKSRNLKKMWAFKFILICFYFIIYLWFAYFILFATINQSNYNC